MGILTMFGFKPKEKQLPEHQVVINKEVTVVEPPKQIAQIIPLYNKNQEYEDLQEKHKDFFNNSSPIQQLQSKIGNTSPNIEDVTQSRSDKFFNEAPSMKLNSLREEEEFKELEQYMHIPILEEVEESE